MCFCLFFINFCIFLFSFIFIPVVIFTLAYTHLFQFVALGKMYSFFFKCTFIISFCNFSV